nr:THAP domain-containing protein 5-like [Maniola hyperantus]
MPNCILRYCKNYSQKVKKSSDGVTFHKFPRPGHEKREQWIKFVQNDRSEETWLPSEHTSICSEHFREEDCYMTKTGRRYLKKYAVPVEKLHNSEDKQYMPSTSLLDVHISDSESIFDTPRKITLKKDLRKNIAAKKNLFKTNIKLKRQCRYLKSKNLKLTDIVKKLKSKFPVESVINDENKLEQEAAIVLVFMVVSLTENWKIPVGYFLVAGVKAETKATLIKMCLEKCHEAGVRIVSLTFDGYPCHVIKLVRNAFENKKIFFDENNKKVMKVKLATQLLSMSVAKALELCYDELKSSKFLDSADYTMKQVLIPTYLFTPNARN